MTETILISIVTFASGAVGAAVGALGVISASKHAAKGQMQQAIVQAVFKERTAAYRSVFDTHSAMLAEKYSRETVLAFSTALNGACIVASPQTAVYLMMLRDVELARNAQRRQSLLADLLASMQEDLTTFDAPKVRKNLWNQRSTASSVNAKKIDRTACRVVWQKGMDALQASVQTSTQAWRLHPLPSPLPAFAVPQLPPVVPAPQDSLPRG